jgi:nucleoside-diphosphate-sugar epimerase
MAEAVGVESAIVSVPDDLTPMMRTFPFQTRRCVVYSMDKAARDLDYRPKYDTRSGTAHSYAWYKRDLSATFRGYFEDDAVSRIRKRSA